jgi:mono/diheme cytochrome c family protein
MTEQTPTSQEPTSAKRSALRDPFRLFREMSLTARVVLLVFVFSLVFIGVLPATTMRSGAPVANNSLERGAYLVRAIMGCGTCHTTRDAKMQPIAEMELAGGRVIDREGIHAVAPNITPDPETGIGKWTDAQIINAIRNGKRPDGSIIGPPMPVAFYRGVSDSDMRAVVAYLRQAEPIDHKVEKSVYTIALPQDYGPTVTHVADIPRGDKVAYGQYVASLGHCMLCHTPEAKGRNDLSKVGAGGVDFKLKDNVVLSANLTPANPGGIPSWSDAEIKTAVTQGIRPDGSKLAPIMAFAWYKNTSSEDLDALVAYLRTLKPATAP